MMFSVLHTFPLSLRTSQRKLRALPPAVATAAAALVLLLLLGASTRGVPGRLGGGRAVAARAAPS